MTIDEAEEKTGAKIELLMGFASLDNVWSFRWGDIQFGVKTPTFEEAVDAAINYKAEFDFRLRMKREPTGDKAQLA